MTDTRKEAKADFIGDELVDEMRAFLAPSPPSGTQDTRLSEESRKLVTVESMKRLVDEYVTAERDLAEETPSPFPAYNAALNRRSDEAHSALNSAIDELFGHILNLESRISELQQDSRRMQEVVDAANAYCGDSDWQPNVPTSPLFRLYSALGLLSTTPEEKK